MFSNRHIFTLHHTTVKQAQLRMSVAKAVLLPGIIHLECQSGHHISLATVLQGLTNLLRHKYIYLSLVHAHKVT